MLRRVHISLKRPAEKCAKKKFTVVDTIEEDYAPHFVNTRLLQKRSLLLAQLSK